VEKIQTNTKEIDTYLLDYVPTLTIFFLKKSFFHKVIKKMIKIKKIILIFFKKKYLAMNLIKKILNSQVEKKRTKNL
jgi:hypothetical protein